ncbi:MAG: FmdB family zinc ribbon protein [Terriglobales bacterium]
MPIYEYRCKKCGHRFERMQKFSDPHPADCPDCKAKDSVEQLLSAPAVQFKGSGWYATDYAKKSGSSSSRSGERKTDGDGKTDVKADSGSEKKSESKTESKSGGDSSEKK